MQFSLRRRFMLLMLALFSLLFVVIIGLHLKDLEATGQLRNRLQQDREFLVGQVLRLTNEQLGFYKIDYAHWDDMVSFVSNPDPEWARINLDVKAVNHGIDGVWVLRPDFTVVLGNTTSRLQELTAFPLSPSQVQQLTTDAEVSQFYVRLATGVALFEYAPINPSDFTAEADAPFGWLFVAKSWDAGYLSMLAGLLRGDVALVDGPADPVANEDLATIKVLNDWQGEPLTELHTYVAATSLRRANADAITDILIFSAFGLVTFFAFTLVAKVWVEHPLHLLGTSLKYRSTVPLQDLLKDKGEFGDLGRIVEESFHQEEKLRQIYSAFNAISDAVFIVDTDNRMITHVNSGACSLLSCSARILVGVTFNSLKVQRASETEPGTWLRCPNGRIFEVEIHEQSLPGDGTRHLSVIVARDISVRRQHEAQRLRAQRLENLGTLAGGVAHDMNNMLTPVILMLDEMEETGVQPEPSLLSAVRTSVLRGSQLLRQLLTFGRGFEGDKMAISINSLSDEMERIINSTFPKSISFTCHMPDNLPAVLGDATQLHQVLLNLCVNARDAMPEGGAITLTGNLMEIDESNNKKWLELEPATYVSIEVADTGEGIAPGQLDRIFDPYFTTKTADMGTGLGLATTLGIIRGHNGAIRVTSDLGTGTRFQFLLPLAKAGKEKVSTVKQIEYSGAGSTVLVIEDEENIRKLLHTNFSRMGLHVLMASGGEAGLALYHQHKADIKLVITDLHMPGMNGIAVLETLRGIAPVLPVLVISGRVGDADLERLTKLGISGRIDKPFGYPQMLKAVKDILV